MPFGAKAQSVDEAVMRLVCYDASDAANFGENGGWIVVITQMSNEKFAADIFIPDGDGDYEYGVGSVSLGYAFNDNVSTYIGANYSLSSIDSLNFRRFTDPTGTDFAATTDDNETWFGVGVAAGF